MSAGAQVLEARAVDQQTGDPIMFASFPAIAVTYGDRGHGFGRSVRLSDFGGKHTGATTRAASSAQERQAASSLPAGGWCWGSNTRQPGDGTTTGRAAAAAVAGGLRFQTIAAGPDFTLRGSRRLASRTAGERMPVGPCRPVECLVRSRRSSQIVTSPPVVRYTFAPDGGTAQYVGHTGRPRGWPTALASIPFPTVSQFAPGAS
jgi:hypothetical protein